MGQLWWSSDGPEALFRSPAVPALAVGIGRTSVDVDALGRLTTPVTIGGGHAPFSESASSSSSCFSMDCSSNLTLASRISTNLYPCQPFLLACQWWAGQKVTLSGLVGASASDQIAHLAHPA